eukprot:6107356-Amphidinium_carterae.1
MRLNPICNKFSWLLRKPSRLKPLEKPRRLDCFVVSSDECGGRTSGLTCREPGEAVVMTPSSLGQQSACWQ